MPLFALGRSGDHAARVTTHYEQLARQYDRRWSGYLQGTLTRLLKCLALSGTERVLDLGCGTGEFERLVMQQFGSVSMVGLDTTPAMAAVARQKLRGAPNVQILVARAEALPFRAEEFDVVVSASMVHHVRDARSLLVEGCRVLRRGGQLAILDWCRDFWHCGLLHYWWRASDPTYGRMYRLRELRQRLGEVGIRVQQADRFLVPPGYGLMCVNGIRAS